MKIVTYTQDKNAVNKSGSKWAHMLNLADKIIQRSYNK